MKRTKIIRTYVKPKTDIIPVNVESAIMGYSTIKNADDEPALPIKQDPGDLEINAKGYSGYDGWDITPKSVWDD